MDFTSIILLGAVFGFSDPAFVGTAGADTYIPYTEGDLDTYVAGTSPQAWYSARKETAYSDTDAVPTITDFSGHTLHATQATADNQATYAVDGLGGFEAFLFDGNDFYARADIISNINAVTVLIVANGGAANDIAISLSTSTSTFYLPWCKTSTSYFRYGATDYDMGLPYPMADTIMVADGSAEVWVNGVSKATASPISGYSTYANAIGFSSTYSWNGDIAEMIIWDRVLTDEERNTITQMAGDVFSVTVTIP